MNLKRFVSALFRKSQSSKTEEQPSPVDDSAVTESAQVLLNKGIRLLDQKAIDQAVECLSRAHALAPDSPDIASNLGAALQLAGHTNEALDKFDACLEIEPRYWPALMNAGLIHLERGTPRWIIERVANLGPSYSIPEQIIFIYARALITSGAGRTAQTVLIDNRFRLKQQSEFWLILGISLQFQNRVDEAIAALHYAQTVAPLSADMIGRLGRLISDSGDYGEARRVLSEAARQAPSSREVRVAYARLLEIFGDIKAGSEIYHSLLRDQPFDHESLVNLANLKKKEHDFAEAEALYRQAIESQPDSAVAYKNLADLLERTLRGDEALREMERCFSLAPHNPYFHSDLIFMKHYSGQYSAEQLSDVCLGWGKTHARNRKKAPERKTRERPEKLRIGLLSGSFRRHPVGFLALPGLEKLDPNLFSITCFANQTDSDSYTRRFRALCERWHPVAHLSDQHLQSLIRESGVDILLEMSGHASGHRLPVVAQRVAPVQVKWVGGQFNTMGIDTIDYFLSDHIESPHHHDDLYSEHIYRLPEVYACYEPPADTPQVAPLPAQDRGYVTFGCLNKINKVNSHSIELWSKCLAATANSRLILQGDSFVDIQTVDRLKSLFSSCGIEPERIDCRPFAPHPEFFKTYNEIDIALDPHPYSGCLTTCESLWMGVPVVTLPGPTFAGRHSASFLAAVGLSDWIAEDKDAFVDIATRNAGNLSSLNKLRQSLRADMKISPLCDSARFARNLQVALDDMWHAKMGLTASA